MVWWSLSPGLPMFLLALNLICSPVVSNISSYTATCYRYFGLDWYMFFFQSSISLFHSFLWIKDFFGTLNYPAREAWQNTRGDCVGFIWLVFVWWWKDRNKSTIQPGYEVLNKQGLTDRPFILKLSMPESLGEMGKRDAWKNKNRLLRYVYYNKHTWYSNLYIYSS